MSTFLIDRHQANLLPKKILLVLQFVTRRAHRWRVRLILWDHKWPRLIWCLHSLPLQGEEGVSNCPRPSGSLSFPPPFFFWFSQMISSAPSADPHADDLWQCDKRCEFAAGRFAFFWKCQRDLSQTVAGKKKKSQAKYGHTGVFTPNYSWETVALC